MITNIIIIISACICAFFINFLFILIQSIITKYQLFKLKKNEILKFKLKKIHKFVKNLYTEYSLFYPEIPSKILTEHYIKNLIKNHHLINEKYALIKRLSYVER